MTSITARTRGDGLAVELNLDAALDPFLDLLADAFDADPEAVGGLLVDLAQTRRALRRAQEQVELGIVPDHVADSIGAEANRYREDLTDQLNKHVTLAMSHREALTLHQQLTDATANTFVGHLERAS